MEVCSFIRFGAALFQSWCNFLMNSKIAFIFESRLVLLQSCMGRNSLVQLLFPFILDNEPHSFNCFVYIFKSRATRLYTLLCPSVGQSVGWLVGRSVGWLVRWSVRWLVGQSVGRSLIAQSTRLIAIGLVFFLPWKGCQT